MPGKGTGFSMIYKLFNLGLSRLTILEPPMDYMGIVLPPKWSLIDVAARIEDTIKVGDSLVPFALHDTCIQV